MDAKALTTLEFPKVLERVAAHTAFSAGRELALHLHPTADVPEALLRQQETRETRTLLSRSPDVDVGGARDVRPVVTHAARGGVLLPTDCLDVKSTLVAARRLKRKLTPLGAQFPRLALIAEGLEDVIGVVENISTTLDERGEVLDSASAHLKTVRRDLRETHDRLQQKLQSLIENPRNLKYLQDPIITQRGDSYVIPIRSNFKGRIPGIVHDQSASRATLFIEPLATVDINNRLRQLKLSEEDEIRRIMTVISGEIGAFADPITSSVEALAQLDLGFAKAKYAEEIKANEPVLLDFPPSSGASPASTITLHDIRHPLLDPETVVPIDIVLDEHTRILVITGPNTGGKTVSLKAMGLIALMAQCGLHIPARAGSVISVFDAVYADIGDEQSIEQNLSTFSSHITNIVRVLDKVSARSLVLLDEVGAGTDPSEGSSLARALLSHLLETGATTFVTTHYQQLKVFAHNTPGMVNASVDFDPKTLAPTYHLTIGLPGRSNALAIASSLGLDETIVRQARGEVDDPNRQVDDLLEEIRDQRELARQEYTLAKSERENVLRAEADMTRRLEGIDDERRDVLEGARAQAEKELDELRADIQDIRRSLSKARLPLTALEVVEDQTDVLQDEIQAPILPLSSMAPSGEAGQVRSLQLGDKVWVQKLHMQGVVCSLSSSEADVQIGRMRLRAQLDELRLIIDQTPGVGTHVLQETTMKRPSSPGLELHIRGQRIEEGLQALDRYLDSAALAELPWVRIIHGKGTGRLRNAVRQALRGNQLVQSFEPGKAGEGGDGVTVAMLATGD